MKSITSSFRLPNGRSRTVCERCALGSWKPPCRARCQYIQRRVHAHNGCIDPVPVREQVRLPALMTRRMSVSLVSCFFVCNLSESQGGASNASSTQEKRTHLSIEAVRDILASDLANGQYFVTGNLTREVFREDCIFKDPTNKTIGVEKYLAALKLLFDPIESRVELKSIAVDSPHTIVATWTLSGSLKLPWKPRVRPFDGSSIYTIDDEGLIAIQDEKWSISAVEALVETFTPGPQ